MTRSAWWWSGGLLAVILMAGWAGTAALTRYGEEQERSDLRAIAQTAAATFDPRMVAALRAGPEDVGTEEFEQVRERLKRIHAVNRGARFVYLMGRKDGQLVFLADAEPVDSPDYSAPGDVYDDETRGTYEVFATGLPVVEEPYRDSWGEWVTGLAPVLNTANGQTVAVLGIDINAQEWRAGVARYRWAAIGAAALVAGVVVMFLLSLLVQSRFARRTAQLNESLARELAERRRAEEGLQLAAAVFENTAEGVLVTDAAGLIESVNPAFERITGFSASDVRGKNPRLLKSAEHDAEFFRSLWQTLAQTGRWRGEIWNRRRNGEVYPQETTINALKDAQGRITHYAAVFSDITPQKALEERLRELSVQDGLTGLANRRRFDEALQREWRRAMRDAAPLSLVMADIDHFKRFNDKYGHLEGDHCLQRIARVLQQSGRRATDLVARYGGEEFAVLLASTDAVGAQAVAEKIRTGTEALAIPHERSDAAKIVTLSIGHATLIPRRGSSPMELILRADKALYAAKAAGRNRTVAAAAEGSI